MRETFKDLREYIKDKNMEIAMLYEEIEALEELEEELDSLIVELGL